MNYTDEVHLIATIYPVWDEIQIKGISLKCLLNFNLIYERVKSLGRGGAGTVICYRSRADNNLYAMKEIPVTVRTNIRTLKNEVAILARLCQDRGVGQSSSIVTYHDSFVCYIRSNLVYVIMTEYIEGYSLFDYINETIRLAQKIPPGVMFGVAIWLFETIDWIHKLGYVHRDLKPENIMIDIKNRRLVLIDFGLTQNLKRRHRKGFKFSNIAGTPQYIAPEQWRRPKLSPRTFFGANSLTLLKKGDVWAAGVTMYCLAEQKLPWSTHTLPCLIKEIRGGTSIEFSGIEPFFEDRVRMALQRDPYVRISVEDMIRDLKIGLYRTYKLDNPSEVLPEFASVQLSTSDGNFISSQSSDCSASPYSSTP
jgi:serine/threonine protein kinase